MCAEKHLFFEFFIYYAILLKIYLLKNKTMKVLFLENVVHVAKKGDIKEVKPGYAQNMLFPKKLAVELSDKVEKDMKAKVKKEDSHRRELIENRHNIVEKLNGKKLNFKLKADSN